MFTQNLPPIGLDCAVDPADRVSAIDFIHRVNWLFDAWDIDAMVEAFLPDSVTYHTHGVARGKVETRRFFQEQSPYVVPGVGRQALSLVVDPDDDDGVIVRYHNLLVRQTAQTAAPRIVAGQVVAAPTDMPELFIYSAMTDRLRRTESGWRILERHVGPTSMSDPYVSQTAAW
jgi:SnoaL-like domain